MRSIYLLALSVVLSLPAHATRLTFDIGSGTVAISQLADNSSVVQNYGDRVATATQTDGGLLYSYGAEGGLTPNVVVSYGPASFTSTNTVQACPFTLTDSCIYLYSTGFGTLTNVIAQAADIPHNDYGRVVVTLTADAGFLVTLSSFDLGGWLNTDRLVQSVSVLDGSNNVLFSAAAVNASGSSQTTLNTVNFGGVLASQVLQIVIDSANQPGGNGQNVGLDNVIFGQTSATVPEPSTFALLGGALALGAVLRRRR